MFFFAATAQDDEVMVKLEEGYAAKRASASHSWLWTSSEKRSTSEAIEIQDQEESRLELCM